MHLYHNIEGLESSLALCVHYNHNSGSTPLPVSLRLAPNRVTFMCLHTSHTQPGLCISSVVDQNDYLSFTLV